MNPRGWRIVFNISSLINILIIFMNVVFFVALSFDAAQNSLWLDFIDWLHNFPFDQFIYIKRNISIHATYWLGTGRYLINWINLLMAALAYCKMLFECIQEMPVEQLIVKKALSTIEPSIKQCIHCSNVLASWNWDAIL